MWTVDNAYPAEFSRLVFHLCHVVLGLRPLTRYKFKSILSCWSHFAEFTQLNLGVLTRYDLYSAGATRPTSSGAGCPARSPRPSRWAPCGTWSTQSGGEGMSQIKGGKFKLKASLPTCSWNTYVEHALLNDNNSSSLSSSPRFGGSGAGSALSSLSSDFVIQHVSSLRS